MVTANNTVVGVGGFFAYASRNTHVVVDLLGWATPGCHSARLQHGHEQFQYSAADNFFSVSSGNCAAGFAVTGGGLNNNLGTATVLYYNSSPELVATPTHWRCEGRTSDWPLPSRPPATSSVAVSRPSKTFCNGPIFRPANFGILAARRGFLPAGMLSDRVQLEIRPHPSRGTMVLHRLRHNDSMISITVPVFNERKPAAAARCAERRLDRSPRASGKCGVRQRRQFRWQRCVVLDDLAKDDARVKVVHFRRNCGQTAGADGRIDSPRATRIVPDRRRPAERPARSFPRLLAKLGRGRSDVKLGLASATARRRRALGAGLPSRDRQPASSWRGLRGASALARLRLHRSKGLPPATCITGRGSSTGEMHRFVPIYASRQCPGRRDLRSCHHCARKVQPARVQVRPRPHPSRCCSTWLVVTFLDR